MPKITIKQIAERVGYSVPTVSQILNGKGELYREETRQRILAAARELDYRPNAAARAMTTGRSNYIGILTNCESRRGVVSPLLISGMQEALQDNDLYISMARVNDEHLNEQSEMPRVLRELSADGFLVACMGQVPEALKALINERSTPAIWVNSRHPHDCLYCDDHGAGRLATERLLKLGHRRIAYLSYNSSIADEVPRDSVGDRYQGYLDAMAKAKAEPRLIGGDGYLPRRQRPAFTHAWMAEKPRPTAVIADAATAAMAVHVAAATAGLRVPKELSIVTFNDQPVNLYGPCISTLLSPLEEIGRLAVRQMLTKLEAPDTQLEPIVLDFSWHPGDTLAGVSKQ